LTNYLKIGIAGAGGQGSKHFLNGLRLKNTKVVAVADTSKYILKKIDKLGIPTYTDYRSMIENNELDAIAISLPNHLHKDCCILASDEGADILVEKPMARNLQESKQIADHIRKNGTKLMVGMCHRFIPGCQELKKTIELGTLGQIQFASGLFFTGPFSSGGRRVPEWIFDLEKSGGGALLDAGCHLIDLFLWFFGKVRSFGGYVESSFDLGFDDYSEVSMRFNNGVNALIVANWRTRVPRYRIEVVGECDRKVVYSEKFGIFDLGLRKGLLSFAKKRILKRIEGRPFLPLGDDIYYDELDYFVECILNNEEPEPNADDWLTIAEIMDSVYSQNATRSKTQMKTKLVHPKKLST
jgi:UDP-N-acetylglucosamine 3-dehydrogenase